MERMKFAEHLASHLTPEWRKQYIQYEEMKVILYRHYREFIADSSPDFRHAYLRNFEEKFLGFCQEELNKVSSFYNEKQAFYNRILLALKSELPLFSLHATGSTDFGHQFLQRPKKDFKRKRDLEDAFSELYLGMVLLQNYQQLNYTGFKKILKKHDSLYETDQGVKWFREKVDVAFFHIDPSTDSQIHEIEEIVTEAFQGNDKGRAMKKLRVPPLNESRTLKTFALGFFVGALAFSLQQIGLAVYGSVHSAVSNCDWYTITRLYRGYFLANLYVFTVGLNVIGWRRSGVNHVLIFELDPRSHLEAQHLFTMSAFLNCALVLSLTGFLQAKVHGILPIYGFPVGLMIFYAIFIINPFNCLWREARWWVLRNIGSVLTSGFHRVSFVDFWLMDQMQSLTPILLDFQYSVCAFAYSSGGNSWTPWWNLPEATVASSAKYHSYCSSRLSILRVLIRMFPSLVRLVQCIRRYHDLGNPRDHLANAAKYLFSIFAIASSTILAFTEVQIYEGRRYSNPFFYIWIFLSVLSTLYGYYWDVTKDWGLFDPRAEVKYLREELVYDSKYYYYVAMGTDLLLRFSWAISLSITENQYVSADIMLTITAPLEIGRRCVWNFFRLENEHLNNVGDFRAIRDIAIVPISHLTIGSTIKEVRHERDAVDGNPVVVEIIKIRPSIASHTSLPRAKQKSSSLDSLMDDVGDRKGQPEV